jgi:predicted transcriptional regulator of viral defense system
VPSAEASVAGCSAPAPYDVLGCESCGHRYTTPQDAADHVARVYGDDFDEIPQVLVGKGAHLDSIPKSRCATSISQSALMIAKSTPRGYFRASGIQMAMVADAEHRTLASWVDALQSTGRYTFDRGEAIAALGMSRLMLKKAVKRLATKRRIVVPRRGFYVIVPIEYRAAGAPPPSWFVDDLMRHLGKPYYVGALSAAGLHGAAHQQPQEFQVVTRAAARSVVAGRARIKFLGKRHHDRTPTRAMKTETGTMLVSTPEATAIDLLRYAPSAGGLANVATVLAELAERIDPVRLVETAEADGQLVFAQRLGYLLERVGAREQARKLAKLVTEGSLRNTPLRAGQATRGCPVDRRWRVVVNEQVEMDQ